MHVEVYRCFVLLCFYTRKIQNSNKLFRPESKYYYRILRAAFNGDQGRGAIAPGRKYQYHVI